MSRLTLRDFDYDLPRELIAQVPARERTAQPPPARRRREARRSRVHRSAAARRAGRPPRLQRHARDQVAAPGGEADRRTASRLLLERLLGRARGAVPAARRATRRRSAACCCCRAARAPRSSTAATASSSLRLAGDVAVPRLPRPARRGAAAAVHRARCGRERRGALPDGVRATCGGRRRARRRVSISMPLCWRSLEKAGARFACVTLHVGAGTFAPVTLEDIATHTMHPEWYRVPADNGGRNRRRRARAVAASSPSARPASARSSRRPQEDRTVRAGDGETRIFITPGYRFRVVDRLLTNFHLPQSTLLMLVSAFAGHGDDPRRLRARDRPALPLLQLRRRDAARARARIASMKFTLLATAGRARRGRLDARARRRSRRRCSCRSARTAPSRR